MNKSALVVGTFRQFLSYQFKFRPVFSIIGRHFFMESHL